VANCADGSLDLRFETADVLDRSARHGDLFGPVLTVEQALPSPR